MAKALRAVVLVLICLFDMIEFLPFAITIVVQETKRNGMLHHLRVSLLFITLLVLVVALMRVIYVNERKREKTMGRFVVLLGAASVVVSGIFGLILGFAGASASMTSTIGALIGTVIALVPVFLAIIGWLLLSRSYRMKNALPSLFLSAACWAGAIISMVALQHGI